MLTFSVSAKDTFYNQLLTDADMIIFDNKRVTSRIEIKNSSVFAPLPACVFLLSRVSSLRCRSDRLSLSPHPPRTSSYYLQKKKELVLFL